MYTYIYIYIYIYIYTYIHTRIYTQRSSSSYFIGVAWRGRLVPCQIVSLRATFGWHYLSKTTCLIRPRSFYACFVVSRITAIC